MSASPYTAETSLLPFVRAAIEQGDLRRADELFRQYVARVRNDAAALLEFGMFCLRTDRAETARYLLCRAIDLDPENHQGRIHLGYAQLRIRDFERARAGFEAVLSALPDDASANYGLALCLRQAGEWNGAAIALEKSFEAQPDTLPVLLGLAEACWRSGKAARARTLYEKAERIGPDDPARTLAQGIFHREQGEISRAAALFDHCAMLLPTETTIMLEQARCEQRWKSTARTALAEASRKAIPAFARIQ